MVTSGSPLKSRGLRGIGNHVNRGAMVSSPQNKYTPDTYMYIYNIPIADLEIYATKFTFPWKLVQNQIVMSSWTMIGLLDVIFKIHQVSVDDGHQIPGKNRFDRAVVSQKYLWPELSWLQKLEKHWDLYWEFINFSQKNCIKSLFPLSISIFHPLDYSRLYQATLTNQSCLRLKHHVWPD